MIKGELVPFDVYPLGKGDFCYKTKPIIERIKPSKKILVELDRNELKKMCECCITKCKKTDKELVGCNLIFARKFKVVKYGNKI